MAFRTNKMPVLQEKSASGSVATFNTALAMPLASCNIAVNAWQEGSGTPSPDNVRTINGYSAINIGSDAKYAGFINFNQVISDTELRASFEANGVLFTKVTNGFELSGEANGTITTNYLTSAISYTNNHVYFLYDGLGELALWDGYHSAFSVNGSIVKWNRANGVSYTYCRLESGVTYSGTIKPQIFDLTAMFGSTKADEIYQMEQQTAGSGVAYFRSLFPNDYYDYNAGTLTTVSAVNGVSNSMFTIQIGSTVYGAEVDVNGVARVTHQIVDLGSLSWLQYQSDSLFYAVISDMENPPTLQDRNKNMLCTSYKASSGVTVGTIDNKSYARFNNHQLWIRDNDYTDANSFEESLDGVKFVYPLETPFDIQLTPTQIETLIGNNTIFADTGDVDLTYKDLDIAKRGNFREVFRLPS